MTLIEWQSPLKAGGWGHARPCKTKEGLIKLLPDSSSWPQRPSAWEMPSLPFKAHFHLKSAIPSLLLATRPSISESTPGCNPSMRSVNKRP